MSHSNIGLGLSKQYKIKLVQPFVDFPYINRNKKSAYQQYSPDYVSVRV